MSGIFGKNVLGTSLGSSGLGALTVPWWCWDTPNFKAQHAKCLEYSGDEQTACLQSAISNLCPASQPPVMAQSTVTGYAKNAPCTSRDVIMYVQSVIGTAVDGKWGPNSQAALQKFGRSYKELVPNCSGAAPSVSSSGGGGGVITPTVPAVVTPESLQPAAQAGFLGLPTVAWIGIAGIAGLLLLRASKKRGA